MLDRGVHNAANATGPWRGLEGEAECHNRSSITQFSIRLMSPHLVIMRLMKTVSL